MNSRFLTMILIGFSTFFAGHASAVDYPNKMTGKEIIACNYEADVVFNRKIDTIDKYVTPNYIGHSRPDPTFDIPSLKEHFANLPKFGGNTPRDGCGGAHIVLFTNDYVIFVREGTAPDPKDPAKRVPHTHFDVWRFEGDKIAEHWDN